MIKKIQTFYENYIGGTKNKYSVENKNSSNIFHNIEVATCAVLLEIANVDGELSLEEQNIIICTLKEKFSLTDKAVEELIELTKQEREESIDILQFTNSINQEFEKEEKIQIMEAIWKIIYADSTLDKYEDYFAHKMQKFLNLSHKELIDSKLIVKKTLKIN